MWGRIVVLGTVAALGACGFEADSSFTGEDGAPVTVGFLSATSLQDESSGTVMVPVALSSPTDRPVMLRYAFAGGTATQGNDFSGTNGVLTFAPGQTDAGISVTINGDAAEETVETIQITLSAPDNAVLGASSHAISISANILPRITFMTPASTDLESTSPSLILKLDPPSVAGGTVDYVLGGNATGGGRDYTLNAGTITIPPNTTTHTLVLPVVDDPNDELDENVTITLTGSTDIVVVGSGAMHAHTIGDNDSEPTLSFNNPALTLAENGGGIGIAVNVSLSVASGKPVQVTFGQQTAGSTAFDGDDFNYLTLLGPQVLSFSPGDMTKQIFIDLSDDNVDEDNELAITVLTNPVNAVLGTARHDLTINDNDTSTVSFGNPNNLVANEGDGNNNDVTYTYNVVLSTPSSKLITVPVTLGGNATNNDDYTIQSGDIPVVFQPGQTSRPIRITVESDNSNEGNEAVTLQLGTPTNAGLAGGPNSIRTHTIVNDD